MHISDVSTKTSWSVLCLLLLWLRHMRIGLIWFYWLCGWCWFCQRKVWPYHANLCWQLLLCSLHKWNVFLFFYRTRLSLLLYKVSSVRIGSAKKISVLSGLIITFWIWKFTCNLIFQSFQTKVAVLTPARHIRRFQEYFNHINILISTSTLQFLQFWYQNGVNYLFLIVKSIKVTSGFISKVMKKFLGGATVELFDF